MSCWQPAETAPKDGNPVIADIGLPFAVLAVWNEHEQQWCYASLQVNLIDDEWSDPYFESEWNPTLRAWRSMPEVQE